MNTQETRLPVSALLCTVLLGALVGCSKPSHDTPPEATPSTTTQSGVGAAWDKTKETAKEAYADAKDATMDGVAKLDRATYDERVGLKAKLAEAGAKLDAEMAEWKSDGKETSVAAKQKLSEAKTAFGKSLDDLGDATADGWETAKAKTAAAWADLKAAYAEAKASRSAT